MAKLGEIPIAIVCVDKPTLIIGTPTDSNSTYYAPVGCLGVNTYSGQQLDF
jgi:hypothetical protein